MGPLPSLPEPRVSPDLPPGDHWKSWKWRTETFLGLRDSSLLVEGMATPRSAGFRGCVTWSLAQAPLLPQGMARRPRMLLWKSSVLQRALGIPSRMYEGGKVEFCLHPFCPSRVHLKKSIGLVSTTWGYLGHVTARVYREDQDVTVEPECQVQTELSRGPLSDAPVG